MSPCIWISVGALTVATIALVLTVWFRTIGNLGNQEPGRRHPN
jgi:hypothetical protein